VTKGKVKTVMFEEQKVPGTLSFSELVFDTIMDAGNEGIMLMELYDAIPNAGERHLRGIVRRFVGQGIIDTSNTCRCGRGTIYIGLAAKKMRTLRKLNTKAALSNKNIDIKKRKDGKELVDGKRKKKA
jgi:hypothetical protein